MSKEKENSVVRNNYGFLRYSSSTPYDHKSDVVLYVNLCSMVHPLESVVDKSSYRPTADSELRRNALAASALPPAKSAQFDFVDGKDTGLRVNAKLSDDVVERQQKVEHALDVISQEISANQEMMEESKAAQAQLESSKSVSADVSSSPVSE